MSRLDELKDQLIEVLTEMDKIKPVQFHDVDCDDQVFNFSNVVINESENRVYVEIAMWHDNLPVHAASPLKDGRGRDILPQNGSGESNTSTDTSTISNELLHNVKIVKHNNESNEDKCFLVSNHISREGLIKLLEEECIVNVHADYNETLRLTYNCGGTEYSVSLEDRIDGIDDIKHFTFSYSSRIVKRSVLDGEDYVADYISSRAEAASKGEVLSLDDYMNHLDRVSENSNFLKAAAAMSGE